MSTTNTNETKEPTQGQKFIVVLRGFITKLATIISEIPNTPIKGNIIQSFTNSCKDEKAQPYLESFISNSYNQWDKIHSRDLENFKANWLAFFPGIPTAFQKLIKESTSIVDMIVEAKKMDYLWVEIDLMVKVSLIEIIQKKEMTLKGVATNTEKFKDILDSDIVSLSRKFKLTSKIAQFEQEKIEKKFEITTFVTSLCKKDKETTSQKDPEEST